MFSSVGWGEILVLIVAGLFILGPERLPSAAAWLGRTVRSVRGYATGAREQLRSEFGTELEELREPLQDLRSLRDLNPRRAITKHLFDDEDPVEDLRQFDIREDLRADREKPNGYPVPEHVQDKPPPGERPPFDPDAT